MKKIKIIDLFNKIANGEKVPQKIKLTTPTLKKIKILMYSKKYNAYFDEENFPLSAHLSDNLSNLNDEVEILEDTTEEIEEIDLSVLSDKYIVDNPVDVLIADKINELVRFCNKLNNNTYKAENCMTD